MTKFIKIWDKIGVTLLIAVMVIIFTICNSKFISVLTLTNVLRQGSVLGVAALGYGILLISGVLSLSTGAIMGLSAVVGCTLSNIGVPAPLCLLIMIAIGVCCCVLDSLLGQILGVGTFLATLATMKIYSGIGFTVSNGKTLHLDGAFYTFIGSTKIFGFLPILFFILALFAVIAYFVMNMTFFGRHIYANGGNLNASYLNGVNVSRVSVLTSVLAGAFYGVAAFMLLSRNLIASADMCNNMFMDCLTAAALGGVSLFGGVGKIQNILLGALALQVLNIGLQMVGISSWTIQILKGCLLIFAYYTDYLRFKSRETMLQA